MTFEELRAKANGLPLLPGVYIMMDKTGKVIYVGKAKLLKNRVSSYFHGDHTLKTEAMVSKINTFDVIIAGSEFEALVLENSLIKHHMPQYNILLKDDKTYPFIRVDMKSEYPAFTVASRIEQDGAKYLGPYGSRGNTKNAIEAVKKALMLPTCGKKFPRDIGKERPCLNYHMGACRAWCQKGTPRQEYKESVEAAVAVFEGKTSELAKKLTAEMEEAAEQLRFERAAERRDRLKAINLLATKQFIISGSMADTDAVGYYRGPAKSCFVVLHYIGGTLLDKDFDLFESPFEEDEEAISALLRQYYERRGAWPKTIVLPFNLQDREPLEQLLSENAGHRVYIESPQRGDKLKLVETANVNAREETERATTYEEKTSKTLEWLQKALNMDVPPERIEAYDISNTGSSDIVASMTVFAGGKPLKRDYRKFKIKTLETQDDYHSMAEVVSRRLARYKSDDEKFSTLSDLMLIDGGATHAKAALNVLDDAGIRVPVFGMVKDDRHRTRALVTPEGDEIGISANPAVFALIGTIQEETHRFAIEYHRSLRSKNSYQSKLDAIEGVGEKRRNALLKSFGSLKAVREATIEDLSKVVPKNTAERVYKHFHGAGGAEEQCENTETPEIEKK
ncbi:Excinuclease ABC subunit C [Sporobacter termitidis DSM 10068]|uniref:UvrABC system protein C n=1 Tax=Sporobacter termitidis DSM 10068 TaxID=1123282 RepID=A0A1M5WYU5_9FIRM|nr:excinuclease ABC subunit UvrC [Sporobacter termitidis]SHH92737.1 Excinuclease ABC subunit C [Sporobacter termitidis DSM 10068]